MKKKLVIGLVGIVVILIIILFVFSGEDQVSEQSGSGIEIVSEKMRYAKLEAEFSCQILSAETQEDAIDAITSLGSLAVEYGFTIEDLENMRVKYENDGEFLEIVIDELEKKCPDKIEEFDLEQILDSR